MFSQILKILGGTLCTDYFPNFLSLSFVWINEENKEITFNIYYIPIIKMGTQKKIVRNVKITTILPQFLHLINHHLKTLIMNLNLLFPCEFGFVPFFLKSLLAVLYITVPCCISRSPLYLVYASCFINTLDKTRYILYL